jgi:hypothetical protein
MIFGFKIIHKHTGQHIADITIPYPMAGDINENISVKADGIYYFIQDIVYYADPYNRESINTTHIIGEFLVTEFKNSKMMVD